MIYVGFKVDRTDCVHLIVTPDYEKCVSKLLKDMETKGEDYWYWIEGWQNERCVKEFVYSPEKAQFAPYPD